MKMYAELADWWYLVSPIADYEQESTEYTRVLRSHAQRELKTVLELGSGGGNNASFMKSSFGLTLVDLSEDMLRQSRVTNPECEHHQGDMRKVRLGREFDAVFVHDAVDYMRTPEDLKRAMETAFEHCAPGGVAVFLPDHTRESFAAHTDHGGSDGTGDDRRAVRFLEWQWDPDPDDTEAVTDFVFALRMPDGSLRLEHERHVHGLFPRQDWVDTLREVGFVPTAERIELDELDDDFVYEAFIGTKPT